MKHHALRIAMASIAIACSAGAVRATSIPSYYQHLDFNLTSPTAFTHAAGGFANPSIYSMMPGSEIEFYWNDYNDQDLDRWGLFTGLKNIGFGVVHDKASLSTGDVSITDYRLGLGFGNRTASLGLGYSWSGGDETLFDREDALQLGLTWRPNRYLSLGAVEQWGMSSGGRRELFDLAVRPFGNDRLTLFGDIELQVVHGDYDDDKPWSAGAMLEIPAGLKVIARTGDPEDTGNMFSIALAYSFGGGFNQGVARGSVQTRFNYIDEPTVTTWGVRLGYPERSDLLKPKHAGYVQMTPRGSLAYSTFRFFDTRQTFANMLDAIDDARNDPRVAGIALNFSGTQLTRGQAWEIRQRLGEFRAVGKKVVVFIDECSLSTYYVASIADHLVMDPEGLLMLPGYVMGRTYLVNMLEKAGVGFEEFRFLKYKSAVESLTRHEMSEADREQRQALVDQYYTTFRDDVAIGRNVSAATVDTWVNDKTLFTAQSALAEKVVDELGRWDEVKEAVKKIEGKRKSFVGTNAVADRWYPSKVWGERDKIAVVYAVGPCEMDSGINARRLEKTLRGLRERKDVKAVVVRVDSPGGSPMASDVVAGQMRRLMEKKPVVVSQGDVAASGGYWLSMCSHQIVAEPTTITGSIGVIAGWAWDKGFGEKLGMEGDFVKRGDHADVFFSLKTPILPVSIPHRAVTAEERTIILDGMKTMYARFVEAVAKNRKMPPETVEALAQGRVWTGIEAKKNGLVDRIGGLQDAIMVARELAKIGPGDEAEVIEFSPRGLFKFDMPTPQIGAPFAAIGAWSSFSWAHMMSEWLGDSTTSADPTDEDYGITYLRHMVCNNGRAQCILPPDMIPRDGGETRLAP